MAVMYPYTGRVTEPRLRQIHTDVSLSVMTDKVIDYCLWNEETATLCVFFINILSAGDEDKLDTIVSNN